MVLNTLNNFLARGCAFKKLAPLWLGKKAESSAFTWSTDTVSNHHATGLMATSSLHRVPMPSIAHSPCPPRIRGNQSTPKHRRPPAHHHLSTLSRRATRRRDQAQADDMDTTGAEAQRRALLHQSAESWTRRYRVEIR